MNADNLDAAPSRRPDAEPAGLHLIRDALSRLRFGAIQLTVHEGKLVQIDVTEKTRLPA
jgi:hypothetical protein